MKIGRRQQLLALKQSGYQCEHTYAITGDRCPMKNKLNVHHITYQRLGDESPHDIKVFCIYHHLPIHGLKPA